ncbi:pentatricopeptide repeat-containing protein At1g08070, chloroplastic-like [Cryptomeria japonica]|uniref:pentatricopeptide repeat-containing protein At1g08070, chloroplastic-like n=1 Tax=Cryptomeria japonica TaxID=3369 RepID=UPI0027DA405B|nr:pentatricopeptide repeat-containing protein At1g08070, chloroplastic-like [Cryptomeria japonica]XP_059066892.1 pentatricopeptide repeat-containing protein At1g08070, chloroplastic-like [Cryptomeria japonica]XP_059066893.1 pentatricopeptide repeat-containing protein At1g08070, chloroplastic-like [Cryptomeria japonica]
MQYVGVKPNSATFASILPACPKIGAFEQGAEMHQKITESGLLSDGVVVTALIDMYAKCGSIQRAHELFEKMLQRDVASWNVMIAAYAQNGLVDKALDFFEQIQLTDTKPNSVTFASILTVCAQKGVLEHGKGIHQKLIETSFSSNSVVVTALIDMYAKCGSIQKARQLFDKLSQRNVISWTAIMAGYAQNGVYDKALEIFKQMESAGVKLNSMTFASILPACAKMGALQQGMEIHQNVIESGFISDIIVLTALIDMYAKCGSIEKAHNLFEKMPQRNVVSWNAMIPRHAMNGYSKDVLRLFELMKQFGNNPNHISFVCVLFACSHGGLVDDGCKYFSHMRDSYYIAPTIDRYACMIDLLGRAGYIEEALNFIFKMPIKPSVVVWMCLLGTCKSHKDIRVGEFLATNLFKLDPKNSAPFVLLSNIYAEVGKWGKLEKVRKVMKDKGIKKVPGCSWIEVHKIVHTFCVGETSHPQTQEICAKLEKSSW